MAGTDCRATRRNPALPKLFKNILIVCPQSKEKELEDLCARASDMQLVLDAVDAWIVNKVLATREPAPGLVPLAMGLARDSDKHGAWAWLLPKLNVKRYGTELLIDSIYPFRSTRSQINAVGSCNHNPRRN